MKWVICFVMPLIIVSVSLHMRRMTRRITSLFLAILMPVNNITAEMKYETMFIDDERAS